MITTISSIRSEVADNWPAFVYIMLMIAFSLCFFRDRRAEVRLARQISEGIQADIRARFDRLESLVRHLKAESSGNQSDREANAGARLSS